MTDEMQVPEKFFLERFGLTERTLERTLGTVLGKRIDYADLYFEYRVNEEIGLEEGIVKQAAKSISQGAGVRATAEEKTGFRVLGRDHGARAPARRRARALHRRRVGRVGERCRQGRREDSPQSLPCGDSAQRRADPGQG